MIGIRYEDVFLDINPEETLNWELNNLVFSSSDSSQLPGSFSFPFQLPATPHNMRYLHHPERIDNASAFLIEGNVEIYFRRLAIFRGTMKVTKASVDTGISVYIVVNPLSTVKNTPLNELDLGGDRAFANAAAVLSHAKDTAVDPLDYDYVFFPIYNRDFLTASTGDLRYQYQNWYNTVTQVFAVDDAYPAMMPFVRIEYLLNVIFAGTDYTFENRWQITDELRRLVAYNNKSMWTDEGLDTTINLQNHVSKTTAAAYIRKLMGAFCLGLFYNPWDKLLRLIPLQSLLDSDVKHNWTDKILYAPTVNSSTEQPEIICWKRDDDDGTWAYYDKYIKPAIDDSFDWADILTAPAGTYYIVNRHSYYLKNSIPRYFFKFQTLGCGPTETGKPVFEAECQALWDVFMAGEGHSTPTDSDYDLLPQCRIKGNVKYVSGDDIVSQENECPDRITLYRGMYTDMDGDDYPMASGIPWDGDGNLIGEYSLRWDGQYGMYETWWKGWHTMLRQGKNVTALLHLSITDLLSFQFEHKVRIQNQDFFVKRLRITLTPRGLAPVEAELVSVI